MSYAPSRRLLNVGSQIGVPQVLYVPDFLDRERADALLAHALADIHWQRERLTLFGRALDAPRLTAWFGDCGASYRYSGAVHHARPWPKEVRDLARHVAEAVGWPFNFVLVNRFRNGDDTLSWHSDDERDLGAEPVIASVSVGAERTFRLRPRQGGASIGCSLQHGSLLLMWGRSQRDYKHCVPRTKKRIGERVNFTFRLTGAAGVKRGSD